VLRPPEPAAVAAPGAQQTIPCRLPPAATRPRPTTTTHSPRNHVINRADRLHAKSLPIGTVRCARANAGRRLVACVGEHPPDGLRPANASEGRRTAMAYATLSLVVSPTATAPKLYGSSRLWRECPVRSARRGTRARKPCCRRWRGAASPSSHGAERDPGRGRGRGRRRRLRRGCDVEEAALEQGVPAAPDALDLGHALGGVDDGSDVEAERVAETVGRVPARTGTVLSWARPDVGSGTPSPMHRAWRKHMTLQGRRPRRANTEASTLRCGSTPPSHPAIQERAASRRIQRKIWAGKGP
jgi:hypothetical protein